ncbi:MAG: DUF3343 domain-containing protein [Oscillospiraceae bacterium]|nr:DUF3343 domain-containing protein [Oscillospiraceae bacterium]
MIKYIFTFKSLTNAQRALKTLSRAGITADIVRQSRAISKNGCGSGIRIAQRHYDAVSAVFDGAGITPVRVYSVDALGQYRQVGV